MSSVAGDSGNTVGDTYLHIQSTGRWCKQAPMRDNVVPVRRHTPCSLLNGGLVPKEN